MSRILNFNTFAKLYEAEGDTTAQSTKTASPPTQGKESSTELDGEAKGLLSLIMFLISSSYGTLLSLVPEKPGYPDAIKDFTSVISANPDQKDETIKKILSNVANAIDVKFKEANLNKLWTEAGDLGADAYAALVDQFKDDKEKSEAAASLLNRYVTGFIEDLKASKEEHKPANESEEYEYYDEFLDEGIGSKIVSFFTGKKGDVNNLIKQGIVVDSLLKQEAKNEKLKPDVAKLQTELDSMMAKLAKLSKSRSQRKETDDSELDKMSERMGQMPFELNKKKEEIAKASKSYSEAASLFTKGQIKAAEAQRKTTELKEKFKEEAKNDKGDSTSDGGSTSDIKLENTISYNKANSGKVNDVVAKVQQLIYDKFKEDKKVAETALFKKFASYFKDGKPDGKFGPSTAGLIRALRAGFELEKNSNISQKFIDELTAHKMVNESYAAKYLAPFMLEDFDYEAFKSAAGSSSSSSSSSASRSNPEASSSGASSQASSDRKGLEQRIVDEMEKRKTEGDVKSLRDKLKEIGFKEIPEEDSKKRGDKAVGFLNLSNQKYLIFPSFQLWRDSTRKPINLPKDAFLSDPKSVKIRDESGVERDLAKELSKAWPQYIWEYYKKLDSYLRKGTGLDKTFFPKLMNLKEAEVKTLSRIYKKETGKDLKTALTEKGMWTGEQTKKFAQKYNGVLSAS